MYHFYSKRSSKMKIHICHPSFIFTCYVLELFNNSLTSRTMYIRIIVRSILLFKCLCFCKSNIRSKCKIILCFSTELHDNAIKNAGFYSIMLHDRCDHNEAICTHTTEINIHSLYRNTGNNN